MFFASVDPLFRMCFPLHVAHTCLHVHVRTASVSFAARILYRVGRNLVTNN